VSTSLTDSAGRSFLRAVESYYEGDGSPGTLIVGMPEVARLLGLEPREIKATAGELVSTGLLSVTTVLGRRAFMVTAAGRTELENNRSAFLLVQVDDRLAEDVFYLLERVNGVERVEVHGNGTGCCCQHCPHGGNCRD
jgi:hypothetical protein